MIVLRGSPFAFAVTIYSSPSISIKLSLVILINNDKDLNPSAMLGNIIYWIPPYPVGGNICNVIPKINMNNTLMITCSSNNQNFIGIPDDNKGKYLIRKIDIKIQSSEINYNKYNYCVSNYKLSSNIIQNLNLKLYEQINFTEIVRSNLIDILSLPINPLIEPMYISDNKMFNWIIVKDKSNRFGKH